MFFAAQSTVDAVFWASKRKKTCWNEHAACVLYLPSYILSIESKQLYLLLEKHVSELPFFGSHHCFVISGVKYNTSVLWHFCKIFTEVLPNIKKQCINLGGTINRATKFSQSKKRSLMTGGQLSHRVGTAYSPFRLKHSTLNADFQKMRNCVCSIRYAIEKKMFVRRLYKLRSVQRYLH